jgi:four helix bundle protein
MVGSRKPIGATSSGSRGSVQECVPLLELARRRGLVTSAEHANLKDRLEEIARMLSRLIKGLENREV